MASPTSGDRSVGDTGLYADTSTNRSRALMITLVAIGVIIAIVGVSICVAYPSSHPIWNPKSPYVIIPQ